MPPSLVIAATAAATVVVVAVLVFFIWYRRRRVNPAPSPVSPTLATTSPHQADPHASAFDDEWQANAPYPDYTPRTARISASLMREASRAQIRHRNFSFDDSELDDRYEPSERGEHDDIPEPRFTISPSGSPTTGRTAVSDVGLSCPRCHSSRIDTLNIARKAGTTIGSVAGATSGMAMALSGAEAGAVVGAVGGPIGSIFGGLAGAVIAGLVGSAAGCAAGSMVGGAIDENVLDNYRCRTCGHVFSVQQD
ncbi:hypothetical protein AB1286_18825 [Trinickia sp. NRRL B-1857]|uniref:hypothetical protein n=1 Tax=Trinickia sp. NRRL B-1857 TaxID=3162879 RepID=UPI003D2DD237